jgi:hypothetical protein
MWPVSYIRSLGCASVVAYTSEQGRMPDAADPLTLTEFKSGHDISSGLERLDEPS